MLKKKSRVAILMISMFCVLLSSCGIPNIRVFSSNFTLSSGSEQFYLNISDVSSSDFTSPSPGILLLYTISSDISGYLSVYNFNNEYAQTTHGVPVSFAGSPMIASTSVGSGEDRYETGFYPLVPEGLSYSDISAPGYTFSLYSYLDSFISSKRIPFEFSIEESGNGVFLSLSIDGGSPIRLLRYNQNPFYSFQDISTLDSPSTDTDYIQASKQDNLTTTYINVYAAVNCIGGFSNIYWTNLKRVAQIRID